MEVNGTGQPSPTSSGQEKTSLSSLTENFDNFLLLLTQQLKHQDPLSPLDTNQFTEQLVQFAGVEQSISTNNKLDQLIAFNSNNQAISALAFLNTTVEVDSDQIWLAEGGESEILYGLPQDAAETTITILDASGKPVRVESGSTTVGEHSFVWDGTDNDGVALPEGVYSIQITAVDSKGESVEVGTGTVGTVEGVQMRNGQLMLTIGDLEVPANSVLGVRNKSDA
ncbi:flagellar hook capping FlgD N-terminal domain-containing protein [Rhodospirillaceae bacterium SYSU D60014]|uniref:flagellar hook assembly protein FlgD n=1 Tax=Virgifigura deserti TaxID=2268457 RepID=UPI000E6699A4